MPIFMVSPPYTDRGPAARRDRSVRLLRGNGAGRAARLRLLPQSPRRGTGLTSVIPPVSSVLLSVVSDSLCENASYNPWYNGWLGFARRGPTMSRTMTVRRPTAAELRQLRHLLRTATDCWQLRRAEAVALYAEGWDATAIARFLALHPHTAQAYLHAFDLHGLAWLRHCRRGGAVARITAGQRAALCRLADQSPAEVGLPYGRWSLAKLRDYAVKRRIVKAISREHLRRVLEKGGSTSGGFSGSSSAPTRSGRRSCAACGRSGGTGPKAACWCSSTSRSWPSRPTAA